MNGTNCAIGTISHVDHGKTLLTVVITRILARTGSATYSVCDQIDKAPKERAMALQLAALRLALIDAGATPERASLRAEKCAAHLGRRDTGTP